MRTGPLSVTLAGSHRKRDPGGGLRLHGIQGTLPPRYSLPRPHAPKVFLVPLLRRGNGEHPTLSVPAERSPRSRNGTAPATARGHRDPPLALTGPSPAPCRSVRCRVCVGLTG